MLDIFNPPQPGPDLLAPWKPRPLAKEEWADRDYRAVYAWRIKTLTELRDDPVKLTAAKAYYSTRPSEFIQHWMDTYDPRKSLTHVKPELRGPKRMPFVFFERQDEVISFLHEMRQTGENGLFEKARDMGLTWLSCGYSVWCWLFIPLDAIGWGSRKQELVDKIGDMSSIFEKLRFIIRSLPDVFRPRGLKERDHLKSMNIVNPENGAAIIGEIGDSIGRGGRTAMYFKDESAHYERPEKIQSSLDDNTHVQVDISSVNGLGNVFHRRREAGIVWYPQRVIEPGYVRVFIVDWRDHPEKTQEWYDRRKASAVREGLQHIFAQEVDRDYAASQANRIIDPEWLEACVDAHMNIPYLQMMMPPNVWSAGLDVADEGLDRNALTLRQWIILRSCEEWGERDAGVTARRAIVTCRAHRGIKVQYDVIGVGATVKAEYNRLVQDEKIIDPTEVRFVPWNAGAAVVDQYANVIADDEESITNGDMFENFKAQAWWSFRTRCYKTWRARSFGDRYSPEELISLDSSNPLLAQLKKELAQPVAKYGKGLRMMIDKKPEGTKSPNLADSAIQAFFPAPEDDGPIVGVIR